jgi:hypothetical protein
VNGWFTRILLALGALAAAAILAAAAVQQDQDVNTRIILQAAPAQVWGVLNDFPAYPEWNPSLRALEGQPKPKARTRFAEIFSDGSIVEREIWMKSMAKDHEFIWESDMAPLPGLLSAKRKLIMTPDAGGGTLLRHEIEFRGYLAGALMQGLFSRYAEAMEQMNAALQKRLMRAS